MFLVLYLNGFLLAASVMLIYLCLDAYNQKHCFASKPADTVHPATTGHVFLTSDCHAIIPPAFIRSKAAMPRFPLCSTNRKLW